MTELRDRSVLSLKWNNCAAIRKHNRNILLHIEVKSYTTQGRLCSIQTQGRQGCSVPPLATLLNTPRDECRTLGGNRTAVESVSGVSVLRNVFVVQLVRCKVLGGGSFLSPSPRTFCSKNLCRCGNGAAFMAKWKASLLPPGLAAMCCSPSVIVPLACICSEQVPDPLQLQHSQRRYGWEALGCMRGPLSFFQGSPSVSLHILCHMAPVPRRIWSILCPAPYTPVCHPTLCLLLSHNEMKNSCTHNPLL